MQYLGLCGNLRHKLAGRMTKDMVGTDVERRSRTRVYGCCTRDTDDTWDNCLELGAGGHVRGHQAELGSEGLGELGHGLGEKF